MHLKIQKKFEHDKSSQVILDNHCWGVLSDRTLLPLFPIPYEGEIDEPSAAELIAALESQARARLLKYLAEREHSSTQCRDLLARKHLHPSLSKKIIADYENKKYIDDTRFTNLLITSLIERGKSKPQIVGKLIELKLPETLWRGILNELYKPEVSLESLQEMVLKLRLRYAELPLAKQRDKIYSSLARKGFDFDLICAAWHATE